MSEKSILESKTGDGTGQVLIFDYITGELAVRRADKLTLQRTELDATQLRIVEGGWF